MNTFIKSAPNFFSLIVIAVFIALILAAINWNGDIRTNPSSYAYQNKAQTIEQVIDNITYFKDKRGNCFASNTNDATGDFDFTAIDCKKAGL
jgi:hypothetical protein